MTPDEALEVFFVAVDRAFAAGAAPITGLALRESMAIVASANGGMKLHTICTGGSCRCRDRHPGFDARRMPPSTTHVRRRSCHSEATGLTASEAPE